MDEPVNPLEREHLLCVVLPGGQEKEATVHGSKPVMDLLVTLCACYHLNPSDYTVEVLSTNKNNISFKPNSPIGSLEAEKIVLKPKGVEEKISRPFMPEATVRLLINYNKSHKAVVRVNPRVPLEMLLPLVCDKCEFNIETTILLRDAESEEPLDMNKTLNDHELREVFAKNTAIQESNGHKRHTRTYDAASQAEAVSPTPLQDLPKKERKQKENMGILSLFRRKKKTDTAGAMSAPASPGLNKQVAVSVALCNIVSEDVPKKRRAPQPPMGASQSVPNNLSTCHLRGPQRSAESTLGRSTKRRAPPPPCPDTQQDLQEDTQLTGSVDFLNTLEELRESDESDAVNLSPSSSSSPHSSQPRSSSFSSHPPFAHLREVADPHLPSTRGEDASDARCALAKVLTSSVSKVTLVKRLKNSATFPKLHNSSMTQRCPESGLFCTELNSVLNSDLPTESDWEDPVQKKGMTTFKVVPSKKQMSHDPDLTLDVSDQCQVTTGDNPETDAENNQTQPEEGLCSPNRSETGSPLPDHVLSPQDMKGCGGSDPPSPPSPPHDLDNQECPASPLLEFRDTDEEQNEEDEHEVTCEATPASLSDHSEEEHNRDGYSNSEDQSLQSLSGPPPSTHSDVCGSYTDDKEAEEEEDKFPPPPPPVFFNEDLEILEEGGDDGATSLSAIQPTSIACNGQVSPFSEDHQPESTSDTPDRPKSADKMAAAPSRFAQAVAMAVQRSRLRSQDKALGPQAPGPHITTVPDRLPDTSLNGSPGSVWGHWTHSM